MSEVRAIDANRLREKVLGWLHLDPQEADNRDDMAASVIMEIDNAPTIDPERHARWREMRDPYGKLEGWIHEDCGFSDTAAMNYCANCGARMDGEGKKDG